MPAKSRDPRSIRERADGAWAVVSGEQPASLPRGRGLRYLGNEQGEPSLRIEERDLEGLLSGFQRLLAGRPAGVEMGGADAEVDLGWNSAAEPLMRLEVGVVREGRFQALPHIAGVDEAPAPDAEQLLGCPPQPLDDGDGAVLADGTEALADAEAAQPCAERLPVNCDPWSETKCLGVPCRVIAQSRRSTRSSLLG
jgi:hypothetical protein